MCLINDTDDEREVIIWLNDGRKGSKSFTNLYLFTLLCWKCNIWLDFINHILCNSKTSKLSLLLEMNRRLININDKLKFQIIINLIIIVVTKIVHPPVVRKTVDKINLEPFIKTFWNVKKSATKFWTSVYIFLYLNKAVCACW